MHSPRLLLELRSGRSHEQISQARERAPGARSQPCYAGGRGACLANPWALQGYLLLGGMYPSAPMMDAWVIFCVPDDDAQGELRIGGRGRDRVLVNKF